MSTWQFGKDGQQYTAHWDEQVLVLTDNSTGTVVESYSAAALKSLRKASGFLALALAAQSGGGDGSGTVTSVAVESANGFSGTVADDTTTAQVTIKTTVTGLLKGDGTGVSAAEAGTDYLAGGAAVTVPEGGTGMASLTAYAVLTGGTTSTNPVGQVAALGAAGNPLVSGGAGAEPTFTAATAPIVVTLTDGSSVPIDANAGNVFDWPLGGSSHTLAAPSNPKNGQPFRLRIAYGGSFTPLFNAIYHFGADGQPSWTATSGKVDYVGFEYDANISAWCCQGWKLGF